MKRTFCLICIMLLPGLLAAHSGNLQFFIGAAYIDQDEWAPLNALAEAGLELELTPTGWPLGFSSGIRHASNKDHGTLLHPLLGVDNYDVIATIDELTLGIGKSWPSSRRLQTRLEGGINYLRASSEYRLPARHKIQDQDESVGAWIGLGAYWIFAEHFIMGSEFRLRRNQLRLWHQKSNATGGQLGFSLGYQW